jgi:hypothetical protein
MLLHNLNLLKNLFQLFFNHRKLALTADIMGVLCTYATTKTKIVTDEEKKRAINKAVGHSSISIPSLRMRDREDLLPCICVKPYDVLDCNK